MGSEKGKGSVLVSPVRRVGEPQPMRKTAGTAGALSATEDSQEAIFSQKTVHEEGGFLQAISHTGQKETLK